VDDHKLSDRTEYQACSSADIQSVR